MVNALVMPIPIISMKVLPYGLRPPTTATDRHAWDATAIGVGAYYSSFPQLFHRNNERVSENCPAFPQPFPFCMRVTGRRRIASRFCFPVTSSHKLAAVTSSKSKVHAIQSRPRKKIDRLLFNRKLPRSKPPPVLPKKAIDRWHHAWKFLLRFLLESTCSATAFSLASSILFAKIIKKFVITCVVRWMVLSMAIRMCILQSRIASLALLTSDDYYFPGHFYCVLHSNTVKIRKNIGCGSCLFHSIAASILTDNMTDPSHSKVTEYSSVLRDLAVATLANGMESNAQLVLLQNETTTASSLVNQAAEQYGVSAKDYLSDMRQEGVWGGGPEIVALSNSLNRQIVLLERVDTENMHDNTTQLEVKARIGPQTTVRPIYILSTNQRFPMYHYKATNNHFLAVIPSRTI